MMFVNDFVELRKGNENDCRYCNATFVYVNIAKATLYVCNYQVYHTLSLPVRHLLASHTNSGNPINGYLS